MDYTETAVICTKHRLWKQPTLVKNLVDTLLSKNYTFREVVLGEPNSFIFADHYEELESILRKKGYYGIRIKMEMHDAMIEINSNTDGVDNVQYTIFATDEETYQTIKADIPLIKSVIKPSNNQLETASEFIQTHPQIRNISILVLIAITLYVLGIHVFLFDIVRILFSFSPFLALYIMYLIFRRRRY